MQAYHATAVIRQMRRLALVSARERSLSAQGGANSTAEAQNTSLKDASSKTEASIAAPSTDSGTVAS